MMDGHVTKRMLHALLAVLIYLGMGHTGATRAFAGETYYMDAVLGHDTVRWSRDFL